MTTPEDTTRTNQRRFLRVPFRVAICPDDGSEYVDYAINISSGGLCVQSSQERATGEHLRIEFEMPNRDRPVVVEAEIVWCMSRADHPGARYCEMGLRFVKIADEDADAIQSFVTAEANFWNEPEAP